VGPSSNTRLTWSARFCLWAAASSWVFGVTFAILAFALGHPTSGFACLGFGIFNGACALAAFGRQSRREMFAARIAHAIEAIRASRFDDALAHLSMTERTNISEWLTAYAALHDGQVDRAIELLKPRPDNPARALLVLAHAVRRHDIINPTPPFKRRKPFEKAMCELAHALTLTGAALQTHLAMHRELFDRELLDADHALMRELYRRAAHATPYRRATTTSDEDEDEDERERSESSTRWIAIALGKTEPIVGSPAPKPAVAVAPASGLAHPYEVHWAVAAGFGGVALLNLSVVPFALLSLFSAAMFALAIFRKPPHALGALDTWRDTLRNKDPSGEDERLRLELAESLSRATKHEKQGEVAAALALADKAVYRIDLGGNEAALPDFLAVRARCLASLGVPDEAEHELGELRKTAYRQIPAVEWQVAARNAVVRGDVDAQRELEETRPMDVPEDDVALLSRRVERLK